MSGRLTHSPAHIVSRIITQLTLGNSPPSADWPVYTANEPDVPDNCITVFDTIGKSEGCTMPDGEKQTHNGIQVRIRSTTHPVGWNKIDSIAIAFDENVYQENITIDGVSYLVHCIRRTGEIMVLGKEVTVSGYKSEPPSSRRFIMVFNALVSVRQLPLVS